MKHLILFYYIFTFAFGLGSLFTFSLITIKTRSRLLFHILVFYIVFTLSIFLYIYYSYMYENQNNLFIFYYLPFSIIFNIVNNLFIFSIPFFAGYIALVKHQKLQNIIFSVLALISFFLHFSKNESDNIITISNSSENPLFGIFLLIAIAYSITCGIINFRNINDKENKILVRNVNIVAIAFFPGIIYNQFPVFNFNFNFSPLLYCAFCVVFITYIVKIYFRDYYISELEINSLKDDYKLHKKSKVFDKFNLSDREREVIIYVLKGYSNKKIADILFISLSTVKTHIHNAFQKTGVSNRYELIHLIKFS